MDVIMVMELDKKSLKENIRLFLKNVLENFRLSPEDSIQFGELIEKYPDIYVCFYEKRKNFDFLSCDNCKEKVFCAKIFFILSLFLAHKAFVNLLNLMEQHSEKEKDANILQ